MLGRRTGAVSATAAMLAAALVLGAALLLAPMDYWDGRILDHAFDTEQIMGVRNWFTTSGWHLQYYIFAAARAVSDVTGVKGSFLLDVITILALCGLVYESARAASRLGALDGSWPLAVAFLVAMFPAWNVLLSSVLFIYVLCCYLVLLGVRLIFDGDRSGFMFGAVATVASLQLNSNFLFSIVLASAYLATDALVLRAPVRPSFVRWVGVATLSVSSFLLLRMNFTPSGDYADYNRINLPGSVREVLQFFFEFARYLQYPTALAAILLFFTLLTIVLHRRGADRPDFTRDPLSLIWPIVIGIALSAAAAFPYVVVGKAADLRSFADWNQRHTFPMVVPIAIFIGGLARYVAVRAGLGGRYAFAPIGLVIIFLGIWQTYGVWQKYSRAAYEAALISALQQRRPPASGVVLMIAPQAPGPWFRYYEANWILVQAYRQENWLATLTPTKEQGLRYPEWLNRDDGLQAAYRSKYMMRSYEERCLTVLSIRGGPFHIRTVAAWIFGGKLPDDRITVDEESSTCKE